MIAVGLSWKMAIGACVLGNAVMGLVITINGRMGATVGCVLQEAERSLLGIASHSVPRSHTHAIWLLLQLLRRRVPLRPRHRLARVSLSDPLTSSLQEADCTQCPNRDWRPMHDRLAHGHLAKLCQHPQPHTCRRGHHHGRNVWVCALLPASASFPMHPLH
jgi:hypothetical protein